jgi:AraC family transcriptional regulator of adaptative response/methylated-DNA-[protein]-cysteine methyltransferase
MATSDAAGRVSHPILAQAWPRLLPCRLPPEKPQETGGKPPPSWQTVAVNDYERISRVIRHLDEHHIEQPDLAELADSAGLNPFHFHRLFSSWAGVTPKDFLQCLTLAHARELLRQGESVLNTALETGLSGPGRLHDLCVNLESASPGEMKSGGASWTITAGFAESPFGTCLVAQSPRGICHLSFIETGTENAAWAGLQKDWPRADWRRNDSGAAGIIRQIFTDPAGQNRRPTLRAFVTGTPFQVRVWRALLQIPPGQLTSYGRLAAAAGNPAAARAAGTAVGQNPLAYLIPCHRVIRETGVMGNYRWGRTRKRALLAWESARETIVMPSG